MSGPDGAVSPDLLSRALAGESAAFRALVVVHRAMVYSLALRTISDRHRAEDLSQEVFLQLHRSLASIQSPEHLEFWLRRVTMNKAIDALRREPSVPMASLEDAWAVSAESPHEDPLLARHLRALVHRLPPAARAVVVLRYQEDLDPVDIGRVLKMPVNTVKSHLKRSLAMLRKGAFS